MHVTDLRLWPAQCIKNHFSGEGVEAGATLRITFSGDEINLDIPDVGINLPSGWFLKPLQHPTVTECINFAFYSSPSLPSLFHFAVFLPSSIPLSILPFPNSPPQLQRSTVDSYQPGQLIPHYQLQLQWIGTEPPHQKLSHHLKLLGANPSEIEIILSPPHQG